MQHKKRKEQRNDIFSKGQNVPQYIEPQNIFNDINKQQHLKYLYLRILTYKQKKMCFRPLIVESTQQKQDAILHADSYFIASLDSI